ncbi:MAG: carboxymuconolactone decarboxylase family protein [Sphingobacteriia bacterium]|nr:carboxymuconolactone decarboxylase family protein [Sphingobacteriia bacterium]
MKSEKFQKGKSILDKLSPNGSDNILNNMGKFSPDMAEYIHEYIFGSLYARDGLDLKTKQIITLTCLAMLGFAKPQLEYHIKVALNLEISREELIDIFIHTSGYGGFPVALNAITAAKEVFEKLDNN